MLSAAIQLTETPTPRVPEAEARIVMAHELAELGMALTRATVRRAIEDLEAPQAPVAEPETAKRPAAPRHDPAESFAKLSRAVRLTIMLEAKLDEALCAYLAGEVVKAEATKARAAKDPHAPLKTGKKARARDLVRDVMDHEIPDPDEYEILMDALDERLLCDEAYRLIDDLPLRDIVERLCADLQLKPDWKRWAGDGWKPNPPFFRRPCSLFHDPSRKPILADLPDPDALE